MPETALGGSQSSCAHWKLLGALLGAQFPKLLWQWGPTCYQCFPWNILQETLGRATSTHEAFVFISSDDAQKATPHVVDPQVGTQ